MWPLMIKTVCASRKASISLARSLIRSFTEGGIEGVSLQSSDIGADVRMFSEEEKKGWDIFVYETADGGIGLLNAIHDIIKKSLDDGVPTKELPGLKKCIEILEGAFCSVEVLDTERNPHTIMQRPCESICHGCLLDFTTQYMMSDLDRELGNDLIRYVLGGTEGLSEPAPSRSDMLVSVKNLLDQLDVESELRAFPDALQTFPDDIDAEFHLEDRTAYESIKATKIINEVTGETKEMKIYISSPLLDVRQGQDHGEGKEFYFAKPDILTKPQTVIKTIKDEITPRRRNRSRRRT